MKEGTPKKPILSQEALGRLNKEGLRPVAESELKVLGNEGVYVEDHGNGLSLLRFDKPLTSEEALKKMKEMGFRPAKVKEFKQLMASDSISEVEVVNPEK